MIYLLGSSKGGVGKSTMAVNAAAWLALHGRDVLLVDTDVQRHASAWHGLRDAGLPRVHLAQAFGRQVPSILRQHAERYSDLVVDAGGRDSAELRGALRVADVLVMPVIARQFDLYATKDVASIVEEARLFRPELIALAFLNMVSTNWVLISDARMARDALDIHADSLHCLKACVHMRRPFATSVEDGRAVFEMGAKGAEVAAQEFDALWKEVTSYATPVQS